MSSTAADLDRLLEPLAECFTAEVAARVADLRATLHVLAMNDWQRVALRHNLRAEGQAFSG